MKRNLKFHKIIFVSVAMLVSVLVLISPARAVPARVLSQYYNIQLPEHDYVAFYARGMGPGEYVVLDFQQREARVYGRYHEEGLLSARPMTDAEYDRAIAILTSDQVKKIPERNYKPALDAFEFSAYGIIQGVKLKFYHILPEDPAVLELYDLYQYYCGESRPF